MKKILTFILAAVLLCSLAACGAPNEPDPGSAALPPYLGNWELKIFLSDGAVAHHALTLGENGSVSYGITVTLSNSVLDEQVYSFYDWTEEDGVITCEDSQYALVLKYDAQKDTLTETSNESNVFVRVE